MSVQVKMQKKRWGDKEQSRGEKRALHADVFNFFPGDSIDPVLILFM